jgi:hypothetical protein
MAHEVGDARMKKWFAPKHRDVRRPKPVNGVDAPAQDVVGDFLRVLVVLGAISARQIAAPGDDELHLDGRPSNHEVPGRP